MVGLLNKHDALAETFLKKMTFRTLQKECIIRGMEFQKVVDNGYFGLSSFFAKHMNDKQDESLLVKYDNWLEERLKERDLDETFFHSSLRMTYVAPESEDGKKPVVMKAEGISKKKKKDGKKPKGITKKARTLELVSEGYEREETIEKILSEFPDAKVKSIKIWYNKAKKETQS